ncbi:cytochrome c553 [Sphaerotilus hippei]|uniref:Cytochrome c553 n=2 Tax=Sphaerotilus hippei TaxID=744406 RepID=A0A318H8J4_9BURK|nr:cytochrome c553 [Sphaerotilus hippei]
MCIGCHGIVGYRASFPEVYQVPMISGQGARYLSAALQAYRKGDRRHPTMRSIAGSLSDQDIEDLAAFYAAQLPAAPPPAAAAAPDAQVADLLKRGNCAACHGEGLNKPIDASYPKLAGQHGDYLYAALRAYRVENHPQVGRANAIMAAQAKPYTPAELKALSTYIASLPGELQTVPNAKFR